jgi:hypothetical protein
LAIISQPLCRKNCACGEGAAAGLAGIFSAVKDMGGKIAGCARRRKGISHGGESLKP